MTPLSLDELRELFLNAPESGNVRWVALVGSLVLVASVLALVRRRALRAEFTPLWLATSAAVLLLALRLDLLRAITRAIGAWTPSSTLFFLGEVFLLGIALHLSVRLSRTHVQIKDLAQEVALLEARIRSVEERGASASPNETS